VVAGEVAEFQRSRRLPRAQRLRDYMENNLSLGSRVTGTARARKSGTARVVICGRRRCWHAEPDRQHQRGAYGEQWPLHEDSFPQRSGEPTLLLCVNHRYPFDVLPRHRLLRQPHGFEGFLAERSEPKPNDFAAAKRPDGVHGLLNFGSALLPRAVWRPATKTLVSPPRKSSALSR
jgi:hypothetical protein